MVRAAGDSATPAGAPDVPPANRVDSRGANLKFVREQIAAKEAKLETLMANVLQTKDPTEKQMYSARMSAIEADLAKLRDQETALLPQTTP